MGLFNKKRAETGIEAGKTEGKRIEQKEKGEPIAVFELDMARHSDKTKINRPVIDEGTKKIKRDEKTGKILTEVAEVLSEKGLDLAAKKGRENEGEKMKEKIIKKVNAHEKIEIFDSLLERTGQSSVMRMAGYIFANGSFQKPEDWDKKHKEKFTTIDPQDIVDFFTKGENVKETRDGRLGFMLGEKDGPYYTALFKAFGDKLYMNWMLESSDRVAIESKEDPKETTTFSIQAGNVADFIRDIGEKRAKGLVEKDKKEDFAFATSHQSVLESFLYKAIKLTEGQEAADDFIKAKPAGFDINEGFKMRYLVYSNNPGDFTVELTYNGKKYKVTPKMLNEIIQEGEDQKKKMEVASKAKKSEEKK